MNRVKPFLFDGQRNHAHMDGADTLPMVRVRMEDGATVELSRRAAEDLYDLMWSLASAHGAVTTAAKLKQALRSALIGTVDLDARESAVFERARELVEH